MVLTLAVLGHHDPERFGRAVASAEQAAARSTGVRVQPVVDATGSLPDVAGSWAVQGGTAAAAKAALFTRWVAEAAEDDWVYQLDGDDVLHSGAAGVLLGDIQLANDADLIGYYGFDLLGGPAWGCPAIPPWPRQMGYGEHWDRYPYITSWMPSLWGRRAARTLLWDVDMEAYEDGLLCYQALALHQMGLLRVCISSSIGILQVDRSTPGSVQKTVDMDYWADELRRRRFRWVVPERSNWGELDILAP